MKTPDSQFSSHQLNCEKWSIVNGDLIPSGQATVSIFDRGFLYGDAIFETMLIYHSVLFKSREHWGRLQSAASGLHIGLPVNSEQEFCDLCLKLCQANNLEECVIRFSVSRGVGPRGLGIEHCHNPFFALTCYPWKGLGYKTNKEGVKLHLCKERWIASNRLLSSVKSANYLGNILAFREAMESGADDALLVGENDEIIECSSSNFFVVDADGIKTPPLSAGCLPGITRSMIIELCTKLNIAVCEAPLSLSQLSHFSESFITNSVWGILPVSGIDDLPFECPGKITQELCMRYGQLLDASVGR